MRDPRMRLYDGPAVPRPDASRREPAPSRLDLDVARAVLDNTAALICLFDAAGHILLFNRACEELTGFRAEEVLGSGVWEALVVPEEREIARREIPWLIASGRGGRVEGTWQDRQGARHLISWHNMALLDEQGAPDRMACVGVDITEQREVELRLRQLAETDVLTGLLNRRSLFEALVPALDVRARGCGVLYCDLDGFKQVNDGLGHVAGDALLVEVAARLRSTVRTGDLVARLGGDEFVVLCLGTDARALEDLADRVRTAVSAPYELGAGTARIGISVGAHVASAGASADEVLTAADRREYAAKRAPAA